MHMIYMYYMYDENNLLKIRGKHLPPPHLEALCDSLGTNTMHGSIDHGGGSGIVGTVWLDLKHNFGEESQ